MIPCLISTAFIEGVSSGVSIENVVNSHEVNIMSVTNRRNPAISQRQLRALPILLSSRSITDAARRLHLNRDTLHEWLSQTEFRKVYDEQLSELVKSSIGSLKLAGSKAVDVLNRLLDNRSPSVRFKAACRVIDSLEKFIELENIEARLSELERRIQKETKP